MREFYVNASIIDSGSSVWIALMGDFRDFNTFFAWRSSFLPTLNLKLGGKNNEKFFFVSSLFGICWAISKFVDLLTNRIHFERINQFFYHRRPRCHTEEWRNSGIRNFVDRKLKIWSNKHSNRKTACKCNFQLHFRDG